MTAYRRVRAALAGTLVAIGWLLTPSASAFAQSSAQSTPVLPRWHVQVHVVTSAEPDPEFTSLLQEWFQLSAIPAEIHEGRNLDPREVLSRSSDQNQLRIWVSIVRADLARVYFVEPSGRRVLLREVALRAGLDEVAREQLAQVIVTSATAFMERRASSSIEEFARALEDSTEITAAVASRIEPPESRQAESADAGSPPLQAGSARRLSLRIGALYQLHLQQGQTALHGPGGLLGVAYSRDRQRWLATVKAHYSWSRAVELPEVNLGLDVIAVYASFGVMQRIGSHLEAGIEVGGGADYVSFSPSRGRDEAVHPTAPGSVWRPGLRLDARGTLVSGPAHIALLLGASAYLTKNEYAVRRDGLLQVVYSSFPLEPHVALEISHE